MTADEAKATAPTAPAEAPVEASVVSEEFDDLGDFPSPVTIRATPLVGAALELLGAVPEMENGQMSYRGAVRAATEFFGLLQARAVGGVIKITLPVFSQDRTPMGFLVMGRIDMAMSIRDGSDIGLVGSLRVDSLGALSTRGRMTDFRGILQFDRAPVEVQEAPVGLRPWAAPNAQTQVLGKSVTVAPLTPAKGAAPAKGAVKAKAKGAAKYGATSNVVPYRGAARR